MLINRVKMLISGKQIRVTKLGFLLCVLHYKNYVTLLKNLFFFII